ncbi:phage tail protein [Hymenobacter terricola]|uniref:phage tail protein n=1 Tax=Hymenobacter terricola TaxID=2819236 RepID=UPI001B30327E|nr:tail fiber protein [Hymenobacter terricola]
MDPFVGEIRAVGFNFAPRGWAICDGSLLAIRTNTALFSLIGTHYGGDGKVTFGLPDLRGRAIVNTGPGPGLTEYPLGSVTGTENVTLDLSTIPPHVHTLNSTVQVHSGGASTGSPASNYPADTNDNQYGENGGSGTMAAGAVKGTAAPVGGSQPHTNLMPYLVVSYVIALQGIFPQRP